MDRITTTSIVKNLKIPFGRLREWIVRGYIQPSFPSPGQGQAAEFTLEDVLKISAFKHMIDGGLTRETAASYIRSIGDLKNAGDTIVFTRSDSVTEIEKRRGLERPLREGEFSTEPVSFSIVPAVIATVTGTIPIPTIKTKNARRCDLDLPEDWSDVYVLNFRKIRESVEKAFGR